MFKKANLPKSLQKQMLEYRLDLRNGFIYLAFDEGKLSDVEVIPRGLYLKEIYAGGDDEGWLKFSINRKADIINVISDFIVELKYTS